MADMRAFAQMLATYVYNLEAASAVDRWTEDWYKKGKRIHHPLDPGTGNWCHTLPGAPAWLTTQVLRRIVVPLLEAEGLTTVEELAARYPDYAAGEELGALAYNLANCATGDGGGDFGRGPTSLDLYHRIGLDVWVGPRSVRLYRPHTK